MNLLCILGIHKEGEPRNKLQDSHYGHWGAFVVYSYETNCTRCGKHITISSHNP